MSTRAQLLQAIRDAANECQEDRLFSLTRHPLKIAGVSVHQLTGRHFNELSIQGSPYILGGVPTEADAMILLRIVAVGGIDKLRAESLLADASQYIEDAFADLPSFGGGGDHEPIAASMAWNIHIIASAYGWDDEVILDKPLTRIYQYVRLIARDKNPKMKLTTAKVRAAWSQYNQWRSQQPRQSEPPAKKNKRR